jgi:glycine cleavage system H lipoate-binding protein
MIFPGWLFKLELTKLHELAGLMSEADYEKFLKTDAP